MKKTVWALFASGCIAINTGCKKVFPDGPPVRQTRAVVAFDKIDAAFSGNVYFVQDVISKVEVDAADNIQQYILTEVKDGKLVLKTKPNVNVRGGSVTVYISNPTLMGATLSGSGNVSFDTDIITTALDIRLSGSGNMSMPKLTATMLNTAITGSGNFTINDGTATRQDVTITGHGDYIARNMRTDEAKIKITGSGNAELWANNRLDVTIAGSGNVLYAGNPSVYTSITGSGNVRKL